MSDIYTRFASEDVKSRPGCMSYSVLIFSTLFTLFGIVIVVLDILSTDAEIISVCPSCMSIKNIGYITGTSVALAGLLGVAASLSRHKCLAIPFAILILVLGLACLALGIFVVLLQVGELTASKLTPMWESAVRSQPNAICDIQSRLGCSGFNYGCCYTNETAIPHGIASAFCFITTANGSTYSANGSAVTWPKEICVPSCTVTANQTTPCDDALENEIKKYTVPITAIVFSMGVVFIVTTVMSILMTRKTQKD